MSLYTMFGVNGVGKDTVAAELARGYEHMTITSESRMCMYLMGITTDFSQNVNPTRDNYKALEEISQDEMRRLEANEYRELATEMSESDQLYLNLSHLVFMLYLDKKPVYLTDRDKPDWYVRLNSALFNLQAPPEIIQARRMKQKQTRDRGDFPLEEIAYHQKLCDEKWQVIKKQAGSIPCKTVVNVHLASAVTDVSRALSAEVVHE